MRPDSSENPNRNTSKVKDDPATAWEAVDPTNAARFGRIRGFQRQGGSLAPTSSHRGRLSSWVSVVLGCIGFVLVGLSIAQSWSIPLLVAGGIVLAAALAVAVVFDLFGDVVLDAPKAEPEEPHDTPLHRIKQDEPDT